MFTGKLAFAQVMDFLPLHTFRRCVQRYPSNYPTKTFSHLDQFLCMAFAQLTFRDSLRDIEVCLRAHASKLYHLGIRGHVARSTLADANEKRDWRIYTPIHVWVRKSLNFADLAGSDSMIRRISREDDTQKLIALAREGSVASRVTRRANALVLLTTGGSCQEVADAFLLNDDTIRGWFKLFEQRGIEGLTSFDVGRERELFRAPSKKTH